MSFNHEPAAATQGILGALQTGLDKLNRLILVMASAALTLAACTMSYSVGIRYFFKIATDWQDEVSIFLLVGATFLSAAYVQSKRGHVAIEALREILPPGLDRWRRRLADILSAAYCLFFSWKSWTLLAEAWTEGQVSNSSWGPPLWIPYFLMAAGMSLLSAQLAIQVLGSLQARRSEQ